MTWGDAGTPVTALGGCAVATLAFRLGDELRVAVVVKATFILAPDGPMVLAAPDPIARTDQLRDNGPVSSLLAASDLVPYRPRADVLLRGHARAPREHPTPAMAVRLMVARGADVVLDKRLAVRGTPDPTGKTREPAPFAAMLLAWELSARTPDNPVGIRETPQAWPHIVDPRQRDRPGGFGPLSPRWPSRRRLLKLDESAFAAPIPALPRDFAWSYFNAAPEDQRVDFFRGDEWVGFEGMNSQLPRVQSYLPGVVGRARVYGPTAALHAGQPLPLEADTVTIDTDRLRCSVVWRGSFPVAHEKYLAAFQVFAGVETAEQPLSFPAAYTPQPGASALSSPVAAPLTAAPAASAKDESRTVEMPVKPIAPATPFGPSGAAPRPIPQRPLPAATPFEGAQLVPGPPPAAAAGTTDLAQLGRRLPPAPKVDAAWNPESTALDAAGGVDVEALLAGKVLPFANAPARPAPSAAPAPPPRRKAFDAGATMAVPAFFQGDGLPFAAAGAPPGAAPPSPVAPPPPAVPRASPSRKAFNPGATMAVGAFVEGGALPFAAAAASPGDARPSPVAAPPSVPSDGATMMIDAALLGASLPFAGAAPPPAIREAAPPVFTAPTVVPTYTPVAPIAHAPTFAPVQSTFAPVAPARIVEPEAEPPVGDAPQTLGAFFLAAMARAGAHDQPLRSGAA